MLTYQKIIDLMHTKYVFLKEHILDNEASVKYKYAIKKKGVKYELVPPRIYLRNVAERAIQNFKDTFVGILNILPYSFPWLLW